MWWVELLNSFVSVLDSGGAGGGGAAYESIATVTGTGSSNTLTFSSIPSTYKHLQIRGILKSIDVGYFSGGIRFNGDTGSNYALHILDGNGSSASASGTAPNSQMSILRIAQSTESNVMGAFILDVHDYASTTANKTARVLTGADGNVSNTNYRVQVASGLWLNTNAVTSISINSPESFTSSSVISLYGIKGA